MSDINTEQGNKEKEQILCPLQPGDIYCRSRCKWYREGDCLMEWVAFTLSGIETNLFFIRQQRG
jgi:hypothetical protein